MVFVGFACGAAYPACGGFEVDNAQKLLGLVRKLEDIRARVPTGFEKAFTVKDWYSQDRGRTFADSR